MTWRPYSDCSTTTSKAQAKEIQEVGKVLGSKRAVSAKAGTALSLRTPLKAGSI